MKYLKTFEQIKMPTKELAPSSTTRVNKSIPQIGPKNQYEFGGKLYVKDSFFSRIYVEKKNPVPREWIWRLNGRLNNVTAYYKKWFENPDTKKKLKNPAVINHLQGLLNNLIVFAISPPFIIDDAQAFVFDTLNYDVSDYEKYGVGFYPYTIYYNCKKLDVKYMETALTHEIGHLIDFILEKNGEKTIHDQEHKCQGVIRPNDFEKFFKKIIGEGEEDENKSKNDLKTSQKYIETPTEIYARLQEFRKALGLRPVETPENVISKIIHGLAERTLKWIKKINFINTYPKGEYMDLPEGTQNPDKFIVWNKPEQELTIIDSGRKLCFTPVPKIGPKYSPTTPLVDLRDNIDIGDTSTHQTFGDLLINFAEVKNGKLIVDIQKLCNVNNELVKNKDLDSVISKTA